MAVSSLQLHAEAHFLRPRRRRPSAPAPNVTSASAADISSPSPPTPPHPPAGSAAPDMIELANAYPPHALQRTQTMPVTSSVTSAPFGAVGGGGGAHGAKMSAGANSFASPLAHSQGHTNSNYSIRSQPSSRSSDTTQGTAQSTLFPPPPPMPHAALSAQHGGGNDVTATDNVMNSVADASSSLFQICVSLRQRLLGVPGFRESLLEEEQEADDDDDPVTLLWRTFRRGYPLMLLYNALRPNQPLSLGAGVREDKKGKAATFKFLQACVNDLKFPQEECFIITDLYGDDTTGFVKVARVVNRVLDILIQRGLIEDVRPSASDFEQAEQNVKRTQRQHIVSELVTTERTYVQHLELLQAFKHLVEERGIIPGDAVHDIFLNLNALLDIQRRFLIRIEQTNAMPESEQNWGKLFLLYCEAFKVYEPYIANQRRCEKTVVNEFAKLKDAGGSVEMRQIVESPTSLYGFLMKPFQRLSKYPLLLDDLYKKGDLDEDRKIDLLAGKDAATQVLARTNHAVDREEKAEAVQELKVRVEDWKGHRVEGFGELLLYGTFTVLKSENAVPGKDGERQYHVYLFETILLCCKDIDLSKPKNKLSNKQLVDKRGKPKLQLKGRIFMQNVTDLISLGKPGSYTCQIFWKGDPSIENFIIRFTTEDMMKKWASQIETQRKKYWEFSGHTSTGSRGIGAGTSVTEFEFMRNQGALENPYAAQGEEEDEDDVDTLVASQQGTYAYSNDLSKSRNSSQTSLRSRSTTGESVAGRLPPPRLPPGSLSHPQLSVRTRELQHPTQTSSSPGERAMGESYFSPTGESPLSSARMSGSSGMYPFPRQPIPQNGYYDEGHGATRFTAPAMARQRQPSGGPVASPPISGSAPNAHNPAVRQGIHNTQQSSQHRNRSASSPDIHHGQQVQPPIPDMPAPYHQQNVPHLFPRSRSNSPSLANGIIPARGPHSQSPQLHLQRDRYAAGRTQSQDPSPTSHLYSGPTGPLTSARRPDAQHYSTSRTVTPFSMLSTSSRSNSDAAFSTAVPPPPPPPPPSTAMMMMASGTSYPQAPLSSSTPTLFAEAPTQLKVKVICPSVEQTLTLVVPLNISYQSLKDRIDAKLQRSTNLSLNDRPTNTSVQLGTAGPQVVKLKYLDEEDFVSIQSDEDVQLAFETWREQRLASGDDEALFDAAGGMGEIELYCQR